MNHGEGHTIYMLGIGGIGMSALARYYHSLGYHIAGYDRTPSPLTRQLEHEGMAIHYEDQPELLPALIDFVVYTPAIPSDLKEFEALRQNNIKIMKRSEALGHVSEQHFTLAIAGTHGKTTTTAMTAHILNACGKNTTAFIGGIANNFESNLLLGQGTDSIMVVEADEFDRSFLRLKPAVSVINSIDADHLDIYGDRQHLVKSFNEFAQLTEKQLIVKEGLEIEGDGILRFGFSEGTSSRPTLPSMPASAKTTTTAPTSSARATASPTSSSSAKALRPPSACPWPDATTCSTPPPPSPQHDKSASQPTTSPRPWPPSKA